MPVASTSVLADAHGEVREALRRIAFEPEHGPLQSGQTVDVVVSQWLAASRERGGLRIARTPAPAETCSANAFGSQLE